MGNDPARADVWAVGSAYHQYVGRWSALVARELLRWLGVADDREWLDVGCGTGTLAQVVLEQSAPRRVLGVDRSDAFVAHARACAGDPRARFEVGDALALPVGDRGFDAVVSGLVLNFTSDPGRMVSEMARACRPGGTVALYVWDYAEGMQLIRAFWDAAVALDPAARALDEAARFPVCAPEPLAALLAGAGLSAVETRAIDVPTRFADFDDYWSPFLGGQGPAPTYVTSLSPERRLALRDRIRSALPATSDGSITLRARAWAARGRAAAP